MPPLRDLAGSQFGKLTVVSLHRMDKTRGALWLCNCSCGGTAIVSRGNLLNGSTSSCRCLRDVQGGHSNKHPLWKRWATMHDRCSNPNSKDYKNYGGRGITVCKRWQSFPLFLCDMEKTYFKGATLERSKVDEGYSPTNVCWATRREQGWNTRKTLYIETQWGRLPLSKAAVIAGIPVNIFRARVKGGWSLEDLFDPKFKGKLHKTTGRITKVGQE